MNHYFIENEMLPENEREIKFSFHDHEFIFKTNNGLFSYKEVDHASRLLMENVPESSGAMLDVGCGYGAIGIVLAKAYGLALTMCDINAAALRYAELNARLNQVAAKCVYSDGLDSVEGMYDVIVTNPPIHAGKDVIFKMYRQAAEHLNFGGAFYLVIQKKHGAESHIKMLEGIFKSVEVLYKKKGYFILQNTR